MGFYRLEASGKHPTMHRTTLPAKNYQAQNVNSAAVEKPCLKAILTLLQQSLKTSLERIKLICKKPNCMPDKAFKGRKQNSALSNANLPIYTTFK